jgi:hypothetical protein
MLTEANVRARLAKHFPGEQERQISLIADSIRADLNAIELALNTLATKLNNDATVTDTNYVGVTLVKPGI